MQTFPSSKRGLCSYCISENRKKFQMIPHCLKVEGKKLARSKIPGLPDQFSFFQNNNTAQKWKTERNHKEKESSTEAT